MIAFLSALNSLSALAVIALLSLVLFYVVKSSRTGDVHGIALSTMKTNDLHDIPLILESIKQMGGSLQRMNDLRDIPLIVESIKQVGEILQRIEVSQSEHFSYLRARINGGNHHNS